MGKYASERDMWKESVATLQRALASQVELIQRLFETLREQQKVMGTPFVMQEGGVLPPVLDQDEYLAGVILGVLKSLPEEQRKGYLAYVIKLVREKAPSG